ncbi:MAG: pilus assembly protein TadG-related protein [Propionicimonas sp.]|nr:hypothetical protein [Propionicimonas sp.]
MRDQRDQRDQRGQALSVFVAVSVFALLLVCGLVVDGGAQATATRRAETAAALAARAAADATATNRLAGVDADAGQAVAAAQRVLAGYPGIAGQARLVPGGVEVTTRTEVATVFLSLIGIESLAATGTATASLEDG